MIITGLIKSVDEEEKILTLKHKNKVNTYYVQKSLMNNFSKYLKVGYFIQFIVKDEPRIYRGILVRNIDHIRKIQVLRHRKSLVFFDYKNINNGIQKLINSLENIMYLDLEMTMHPYKKDPTFRQEVLQVGYLLEDANGNVIKKYNKMIKPTIHKTITARTRKFLKITQEEVNKGIDYNEFYEDFKETILKYKPAILAWGKNDFLALKDSYIVNKRSSLIGYTRYINLLKIHKTFLNVRNDIGLFNAYGLYYEPLQKQSHDAFEDAQVTKKILEGFKNLVNEKITVDTKDLI